MSILNRLFKKKARAKAAQAKPKRLYVWDKDLKQWVPLDEYGELNIRADEQK